MTPPIALQLYTVRDVITKKDYESVVRQVAQIGYAGVETAGFPGTTPQAAGKLFKELGLLVSSIHKFPIPTPVDKQEILDILGALDTRNIVSGAGPDDFKLSRRRDL
jgi:sugar phosphate isomerase/epimerase